MAKVKENNLGKSVIDVLIEHFNYTIKDIKSYDELTEKEKEIIPRKIWDLIVEEN